MITKLRPLTIDDWDAMPYDEWHRYEIIEGELFVSCAPGLTHQMVSDSLVVLLRNFLKLNSIGVALSTPGLVLSEYSGVIPDIVYFSNESRHRVVSGERLMSAPELVIEILSKDSKNLRRDRVVKRQLYAKHRVQEYWIVDCHSRVVEVYRLDGPLLQPAQIFQGEDTVTTLAIPGFSCALSEIFEGV